jgi:hypothetical protein
MQELPSSAVSLFPNPATGIINYQINGLKGEALYQVQDIAGRIVHTGRIISNGFSGGAIDLSPFAPGVYIFRLNCETGTITKKIVIK